MHHAISSAMTATLRRWSAVVLIALLGTFAATAASDAALLPAKFTLSGSAARQSLVLEQVNGKQFTGQLTNGVEFSSSNPRVVKIQNGVALPVTNGRATITAKRGRTSARAEVIVEGMEKPFEWSFRQHVQPVLAKQGCSAGACHGAAAGQNGFRLSLRGYDNEGDYLALTRGAVGRRINPGDPARSLLLLKPTGAVPHKGGKRFETGSIDYQVLVEWVAAGTPGPRKEEPAIERIEILPPQVTLKPGAEQQLIVRAHFADGREADVTHWAKFTAANATVTQVDDEGRVRVIGEGEGAITAWFLSRIAIGTVTVPFTNVVPAATFARAPKRNFIDELVNEKLRELNLPPSPRCTDGEFLRRAHLDTIGVLPTEAEARAFLADRSPKKRDALIEALLKRPEFVDYWSARWSDLLLVNSRKLKPAAMWSYYNWIRQNVAENTPWDVFARRLVTAQGSTLENGAGNFFVLHDEPRGLSETTSLAFLGMSINCARCHNHPLEKWTNDQYYKMANLFARVRAKNGPGDGEQIIFAATDGDLVQPLTGKPQIPAPLDGQSLLLESTGDRREHFADWLVSRDNPYFSRAIVNRIWANFYGAGLVENVDDLRVTNPASNEKLFAAATKFLADQKFDVKALMRAILQSETYQRSSQPTSGNAADTRFYSRYYPRRLKAEVLLDIISQATAKPTEFKGYPAGWRALQLPDANVDSYFLKTFGRPDRTQTCECERTAEPSVTQVLHIANGDTINRKLTAKDNRIGQWLTAKLPTDQIIEQACLVAFARFPTDNEKQKLAPLITSTDEKERRAQLEDFLWALLSGKEFLFNH